MAISLSPPELAVEVASDPDEQIVEVHEAGKVARVIDLNDTLRAKDILPKFELAVKDIFPTKASSK